MIGTTWGTGQVLLDTLWFFLFIVEVWLMISIFIDIFRRHDMKGWLKAFWVFLVIVVPLIGIILYLIIYGDEMRVHAQQAAQDYDRALRDYVQHAAGHSPATELERLAALRTNGTINDDEFEQLKAKVVNA
ncbi:MAG TPA: SHOCT domain-containing protein [Acidimicrobiales bacterium]|jgi:predicted membrane channel-forming protein YqfA (hemolysin III family)